MGLVFYFFNDFVLKSKLEVISIEHFIDVKKKCSDANIDPSHTANVILKTSEYLPSILEKMFEYLNA